MKVKQRTCKSKYMKKKIMTELCEQLTNSFRLTPSRLDKTAQAPSSEIATPQHTTSDGLTHTDKADLVEKTGIEALLPFVEKATPKRPPTPLKTSQDWDKSLY